MGCNTNGILIVESNDWIKGLINESFITLYASSMLLYSALVIDSHLKYSSFSIVIFSSMVHISGYVRLLSHGWCTGCGSLIVIGVFLPDLSLQLSIVAARRMDSRMRHRRYTFVRKRGEEKKEVAHVSERRQVEKIGISSKERISPSIAWIRERSWSHVYRHQATSCVVRPKRKGTGHRASCHFIFFGNEKWHGHVINATMRF